MIIGIYHFYLQLKQNGKIKPNVSWFQFYISKCWYRKDKLSLKQRNYIEKTIINRNN